MFDVHATEEEDRLVLLCALDRVGACTEEQLLRYSVDAQLVPQFSFYLALNGLRENGFIRESDHLEGHLLALTPEGRSSMELFSDRIRASLQEKLNQTASMWRVKIREELSMPASWEKKDDGTYLVHLRALESGQEIINMTILAATRAQAKRFCARWPERSSVLYQTIMRDLGETQPAEEKNESET